MATPNSLRQAREAALAPKPTDAEIRALADRFCTCAIWLEAHCEDLDDDKLTTYQRQLQTAAVALDDARGTRPLSDFGWRITDNGRLERC